MSTECVSCLLRDAFCKASDLAVNSHKSHFDCSRVTLWVFCRSCLLAHYTSTQLSNGTVTGSILAAPIWSPSTAETVTGNRAGGACVEVKVYHV